MSEFLLILHCSPTLAGLKTGSLFSCECICKKEFKQEIRRFNQILTPKGLRIIPLKFTKSKALIYVYRPDKLEFDLNVPLAVSLLKQRGYTLKNSNYCISELIKRLDICDDFPHEIGLFLGYPPEDVIGFINDKNQNFKYSGVWKVYSDVEKAKELFARYQKCSEIYCKKWFDGFRLEKLAVCI